MFNITLAGKVHYVRRFHYLGQSRPASRRTCNVVRYPFPCRSHEWRCQRTVRENTAADRRAATTTGPRVGLNGADGSSPRKECVWIDEGKGQIDGSKVVRRSCTVEATGKLCRPPMASPEPGRMIAFPPFQGFIRGMSDKRCCLPHMVAS
jgi:hypothetical protein